ncbi:MAG: hypothetical protein CMH57_04290 [Myxococcales bacterium]|nr:hypothetical protein [Myxococcales bacterium]
MAKKDKDKGEKTPSADEIIEALALEMGVDEEDSDAKEEPAKEDSDAKDEAKGSDPTAGLGDIFDVPSSPKKGKKAKKGGKKGKDSSTESASAGVDAIDTLFNVSKNAPDPTPDELDLGGGFDDADLDRFEKRAGGGTNKLMIGIIALLALALGGVFAGPRLGDIKDVFTGEYRDKKDAEKRRIEEEHRQKQLDAMEKYGDLRIAGSPNNALIKFQFEGETSPHVIYAQTSTEQYREMRLSTNTIIRNLKIKQPLLVVVEAPGYQSQTVSINKDMWTGTATGDFLYELNAYLQPANAWTREETADRMASFEEIEEDITGVVKVTSNPPGAKIKLNGRLVVDKEGKPVVTPAELTEIPAKPPEDGKKADKPDPININTPPGQGHKIEVFFDDPNTPQYVTAIQRSLWLCKTKDERELSRLPKDARPVLKCDYEYAVDADFNAIRAEIARQKKIEEELQKQKEEMEKIQKEAEDAAKAG